MMKPHIIALILVLLGADPWQTVRAQTNPGKEKPGKDETDIKKGIKAFKENQFDQAIFYFTNEINKNPNNIYAFEYRGLVYSEIKEFNKSLKDYEKALELELKQNGKFLVLATFSLGNGKDNKPEVKFPNKIQNNPKRAQILCARGEVFLELNRTEEAMSDFKKATEFNPRNQRAFYFCGYTFESMGNIPEAIMEYSKALELDPKDKLCFFKRGRLFVIQKNYQDAINDFTKSVDLDPNFHWSYTFRGEAYQTIGKTKEAEADFEMARNLMKPNPGP